MRFPRGLPTLFILTAELGRFQGVADARTMGQKPFGLFDFERTQLVDGAVKYTAGPPPRGLVPQVNNDSPPQGFDRECKKFPLDLDWPRENEWKDLNETLQGALLKPAPAASVCYQQSEYDNYAEAECAALSRRWAFDFVRMNHPIEVVSPLFEGLTCLPPSAKNTSGCTQGGYPVYVVNATNVAQVQTAVNFVRKTGIRLVIKNTGHDFSGKSVGAGSLSIWTHGFKDIQFHANYSTNGSYSGPAFQVGAGVQASDILKAAHDNGHMAVTGVCDSVGIYGGYSQGGGHSPLSSQHGLGADQILSLRVVTADGAFVTASPQENPDLFWAIRGGGGSTFGVVTSMIVKAYPDVKTSVATFDWRTGNTNASADIFWKGVHSYFGHFANFTDQGLWAQFNLFPLAQIPGAFGSNDSISGNNGSSNGSSAGEDDIGSGLSMSLSPFLGIGKSLAELKAATKPWLDEMQRLGVAVDTTWAEYDSYYPAFFSKLPTTENNVMPTNMAYGSRLIPRANFQASAGGKLNATVAAYRALSEAGHAFNGFMLGPTLARGKPVGEGNAVLPAWRDALSHTIAFVRWPENATTEEQLGIRRRFAREGLQVLRDLTPGSGSYMSESDRLEPDFQTAFFGKNYARLLEIKRKYDPQDVFYAVTAVGSERWAVRSVDKLPNENGPLCQVSMDREGAPSS